MRPALILAGRLIDGTGAVPLDHQALVLQDGRIREIVPQSDLTLTQRQSGEVLDLGAATVLPGLIDTHVHLTFNAGPNHDVVRRAVEQESDARLALRSIANAQAHLAGGVTTVRDVGGRGFVTLSVRDAVRDGLVPGPRIQASGPAITTTRGHLNYLGAVADSAEEMRRWAREVLDAGADFIKLCASGGIMTAESDPMGSQYTEDELREAVDEAESRGTLVAAHVLASESLERCVRAGVRSIEHCLWQDEPGIYRFQPEVAEEMRRRNIIAGLTFAGVSQTRYKEQRLGLPASADMGIWQQRLAKRFVVEREMIDAGNRYVLHSDAGVRETPFGSFWLILATACFELGITPLQAITAATTTPAELMGLGDEIGTLAAGKRADLLVVEGNPAEEIEALSQARLVLRDGEVVIGRP
ncbi:MAG: amidohydrolase family protein [Armatimonadetes bacterium]|jgi:imidazolonepropionase-like amidohydrolase|nr:amidohydrolase family protein [Armatimonadota bacterium]